MLSHLVWVCVATSLFLGGLFLGELRAYKRTNQKVVTVVQNPKCIVGRMK